MVYMQLLIHANEAQQAILLAKGIPETVTLHWFQQEMPIPEVDAYMDLLFTGTSSVFDSITHAPVFLNAVVNTCHELLPGRIRINAWPGFLERPLLELACSGSKQPAMAVLDALGWKHAWTPDEAGMIAPRIVAMIINEAYYGWGDGISDKKGIDTAMKLGTNYPFGPFEWAEKIGLGQVVALLSRLQLTDSRYTLAPALLKEHLETKNSN